ncbi:MHYT domain-containing protein [Streptomyces sp. NPDC051907]|uniref:MHYT domain-containing protein n=1 Tax=Streptomyces sp. NPDC051907 TaxID=3155284 RepID=UPI0034435F4A
MSHGHALFTSPIYPVLAYANAFVGSVLGLACTRRLLTRGPRHGWNWLLGGAVALGCGIWGMHFIAMLGYSPNGITPRYDVPLTALSMVVAIAIVGLGILAIALRPSWLTVLGGGVVCGVGIAAMHYIGMAAMAVPGSVSYDPQRVLLSVGVAVVAASGALAATMLTAGRTVTAAAALVMAGSRQRS